jgi:hypothetical protein
MVSITNRRGAGRRGLTTVVGRGDGHDGGLHLTAAQQDYLTVHGFGPAAAGADFSDPAVRARFVELLRECGALAPAVPVIHAPSRPRRHLRRAG